jgi:hypothetical protein
MKKCNRCSTPWTGYGAQPRAREVCENCGAYLHCCYNCHHFDRQNSICKLPHTSFVGIRDSLNYCEEFQMLDSRRRAVEDRVSRAKSTWEELFRP